MQIEDEMDRGGDWKNDKPDKNKLMSNSSDK